MKKSLELRLYSDHHHLILEEFVPKEQAWKVLGEITLEYVSEASLCRWLKAFIKTRKVRCTLLLSEDCFKWQSVSLNQEISEESCQFLEAVKQKLLGDPTFFIDAYVDQREGQTVMLEQAAIEPYLSAFKVCKIRLIKVSPVNALHFNLLPWREMRARRRQLYQNIGLLVPPILACALVLGMNHWQSIHLYEVQNQNQRLHKQLITLSNAQINLKLQHVLPLVRALLQQPEVDEIDIAADGSIHLQGNAASQTRMDEVLHTLNTLPMLAPKSMHDLSLQNGGHGQNWSVNFELQASAS